MKNEQVELYFGSVQPAVWERMTDDQRTAVLLVQSGLDPVQFVEEYQQACAAGATMPELSQVREDFALFKRHPLSIEDL